MNFVKSICMRAISYHRSNTINKNYPLNMYNCLLCVGGCIGAAIAGFDLIEINNDEITMRHPYIIPLYISRGILVAAISPLLVLKYIANMIYKRKTFNHDQELLDLTESIMNNRIFKKNKE